MEAHSNRKAGRNKSATVADLSLKPARKHFVPPNPKGSPLTPHPGGKWMKKINGKLYYFGRWGNIVNGTMVRLPGDGHKEALTIYQAEHEALEKGQPVKPPTEGLTVRKLCDDFLISKSLLLVSGEITLRTFGEPKHN